MADESKTEPTTEPAAAPEAPVVAAAAAEAAPAEAAAADPAAAAAAAEAGRGGAAAAAAGLYPSYDGRKKQFVTNANEKIEIVMGTEGPAAWEPTTVMKVFNDQAAKLGNGAALHWQDEQDNWKVMNWNSYKTNVYSFAKSLLHVGFQPFMSVNIIGFNSRQWIIANLGAIAAGGLAAGAYATNRPADCHYIAHHSDAHVVVCDGAKQLNKFLAMQSDESLRDAKGQPLAALSKLKVLVVWNLGDEELAAAKAKSAIPVHSWDEFMALGAEVEEAAVEERVAAQEPGHACTLIYTSGTTGPPKAVMISHDNATWTGRVLGEHFGPLTRADRIVSYLPLSHIAAQLLDVYCPVIFGCELHFAKPDALQGSLGATLKTVQPTLFFGVPRVWEKFMAALQNNLGSLAGVKAKVTGWARNKAKQRSHLAQFGNGGGDPCGFLPANKFVLAKVKNALGLGQARLCCTGAAPIGRDVLDFFATLDVPIYEVFGQSECTGPQTINIPGEWRLGTTGKDIPGTELQLMRDEASKRDEIVYRGRHIFMGYMKNEEKTKEAVDHNGWLHSGDVGLVDEEGFLSITGRIKELIITAGGENIPPVLIEEVWKDDMPVISNCCAIGDKRKYLVILVAPDQKMNPATGGPLDSGELGPKSLKAAATIGSKATTLEEMRSCAEFAKYFNEGMKRTNLKQTSQAQTIKKWSLIADFAPEVELTPTMKLKRNVVHEKYESLIESMYAPS